MPKLSLAKQFKKLHAQLLAERQRLEQELAQVIEVIGNTATTLASGSKRGRKPKGLKAVKAAKRTRRRRKHFDMTAEQFVLKLVGDAKELTTAQVNEGWKKSGRAANANNALGKLVKETKLVKGENVGGRGSIFKLA